MSETASGFVTRCRNKTAWFVIGAMALWLGVLGLGGVAGYAKLVAISVTACVSMLTGALAARYLADQGGLRAAFDGAAAGAMIASACIFLVPMAIQVAPLAGGTGITVGLMAGAALQAVARRGGRHALIEPSVAALTLHSLGAGFVIGLVYGRMPALGALLGVAIVSHKLPAGYAVTQNLRRGGYSPWTILLPACAVGWMCIPTGMLVAPGEQGRGALVFGFAAGVFLHLAMTFLSARSATDTPSKWYRGVASVAGALLVIGLQRLMA